MPIPLIDKTIYAQNSDQFRPTAAQHIMQSNDHGTAVSSKHVKIPLRPESRKKVSFNTRVRVKRTLHINDYSDEEFYACYWSEKERLETWHEVLDIVDRIEDSSTFETSDFCLRGLENKTFDGRMKTIKRRECAKSAVFGAQRLRHENVIDVSDERIAKAYAKKTQRSKRRAHLTGIFDGVEAHFHRSN